MNTLKKDYWNEIAVDWKSKHRQSLWRRHSDAVNSVLLRKWLPAGRIALLLKTDVFDEAFGDGLYPVLAARADQIIGMDRSTSICEFAESRNEGLTTTVADVRCLPYSDDVFDVIVSNSTLDHFETAGEIIDSLHELHRVVKSDGELLLTLDNRANPVIALRSILPFRLLNRLGIVPYYVGATFGPRRLIQSLQQVGFEVVETSAIMHCPRILAVLLSSMLERYANAPVQRAFLHFLLIFERLQFTPLRFLTGYFVAVKAVKRGR